MLKFHSNGPHLERVAFELAHLYTDFQLEMLLNQAIDEEDLVSPFMDFWDEKIAVCMAALLWRYDLMFPQ
jgi:hypothetical protein